MKGIIRNNHERDLMIKQIQNREVKQPHRWEFTKVMHKKTLSQVAYCWLVFTHIAEQTGATKEEIYQFCTTKFPVFSNFEFNNEIQLIHLSMSNFNKKQMSWFIDEITTFFRVEGYDVPDPEDLRAIEMYNYYNERNMI